MSERRIKAADDVEVIHSRIEQLRREKLEALNRVDETPESVSASFDRTLTILGIRIFG